MRNLAHHLRAVRRAALRPCRIDRSPSADPAAGAGSEAAMNKGCCAFGGTAGGMQPAFKNDAWLGYGEGDTAYISAPQPWVTASMKVERGSAGASGRSSFVLDNVREQVGAQEAIASVAPNASLSRKSQPVLCPDHPGPAEPVTGARPCRHAHPARHGAVQLSPVAGAHRPPALANRPDGSQPELGQLRSGPAQHRGPDRRAGAGHLFPPRRIC